MPSGDKYKIFPSHSGTEKASKSANRPSAGESGIGKIRLNQMQFWYFPGRECGCRVDRKARITTFTTLNSV